MVATRAHTLASLFLIHTGVVPLWTSSGGDEDEDDTDECDTRDGDSGSTGGVHCTNEHADAAANAVSLAHLFWDVCQCVQCVWRSSCPGAGVVGGSLFSL